MDIARNDNALESVCSYTTAITSLRSLGRIVYRKISAVYQIDLYLKSYTQMVTRWSRPAVDDSTNRHNSSKQINSFLEVNSIIIKLFKVTFYTGIIPDLKCSFRDHQWHMIDSKQNYMSQTQNQTLTLTLTTLYTAKLRRLQLNDTFEQPLENRRNMSLALAPSLSFVVQHDSDLLRLLSALQDPHIELCVLEGACRHLRSCILWAISDAHGCVPSQCISPRLDRLGYVDGHFLRCVVCCSRLCDCFSLKLCCSSCWIDVSCPNAPLRQ